MSSRASRSAVCLAGLLTLALAGRSFAADGPTLLKRTVAIKLHRYLRYWPNPAAKEPQYNTYSWVPQVSFSILGPVPGGSQFVAEFQKPTGQSWISTKIPTEEAGDDASLDLKTPDADDALERKAVTAIGTFPFRILLKNEVTGKNEVFFSGKYEVVKYPLPRVPVSEKNKTDFCTVEDWRAPIGYIWLNPADDNENTPPLSVQMWFRGAAESTDMQALLFKDGQQVGNTKGSCPDEIAVPSAENAFNWYLWQFTFFKVRGFNKDTSATRYPDTFFLDKNPGHYQIRVLRAGKLARVADFTVGADGVIGDNGIAKANKLGGIRQVLPVSIAGTADGPLKPLAWQTHAFYGNPLAGFTAPGPAKPLAAAPRPGAERPVAIEGVPVVKPILVSLEEDETPAAPVPTGPSILKSTLVIRADRMVRYWKFPDQDNYWSWVPTGRFSVLGPINVGTKFVVDFTRPDGSLWTSVECPVDAAGPNEVRTVAIPGTSTHMDKRATTDIGTYGFKIKMANEATGAKAVLMSGKFTINKLHIGNALPAFKNQFEYYVDQDWTLPIGYVWLDWLKNPLAPPLHVNLWVKNHSEDNTKFAAYVLYNGKQIASSKAESSSSGTINNILTSGTDDADPYYYLWDFTFNSVRGWNTDTSGNRYDAHFLAANPGTYEIKVLYDGSLIRTTKFTVGADGKIVDNGVVAKNNIGGIAMIVPVQVTGTVDGKWNPLAWKTAAFYGNPLQGFTVP